ncbi:MAG TPA: fibronectin type III domain-containing protein, partial [Methanomassiliicoccales archaeon]|nr:fibronectin type III domain-containing protein [Methanomassiliicoccales archaeon]
VNATNYIASGLEIGVVGYYAVTALNAAGEGERSSILAIASGKTPTYPVNLTYSTGDRFVHLSWGRPWDEGTEEIQKYVIYRTGTDGSFSALAETTALAYNDTTVTNKVEYSYYVRAMNTIGLSDPSNVIMAFPHLIGDLPTKPLFFNLIGGDGYILLRWMEPADDGGQPITSYIVYRGITEDLMIYYRSTTELEYNATNLQNETTYYFKVAAVNAIGEGNATDVLNATTILTPELVREEKFLWGILENMFFYAGLVMAGCVIALWFFKIRGKRRGFRKKVAQKKTANAKAPAQLPKGMNEVLKKK